MVRYTKSHGLGNDYLILDGSELDFPLTPRRIRRICDRHIGVGGDGILLAEPGQDADAGVRILNPDGSEAEKSGNGLRIYARWLWDEGRVKTSEMTLSVMGGAHRARARIHPIEGGDIEVEVEMGPARFTPAAIPTTLAGPEVIDQRLEVAGEMLIVTAVNVGNPHCVHFTDNVDAFPLERLGPTIERDPRFPQRINVQVAQILDDGNLKIRIWERGAGITQASGSSACAVAAATSRRLNRRGDFKVHMPGGTLAVHVGEGDQLVQRGPASPIVQGHLTAGFVEILRALG